MPRQRTLEIRRAILEEVFWSAKSPVRKVARRFDLTAQAIQLHVKALVESDMLVAKGERRYRRYVLAPQASSEQEYRIDAQLTEDQVWEAFVRPQLRAAQPNEQALWHYGVTEMVNNVIDHAGASGLRISLAVTSASVVVRIADDGVGIFQKIAQGLGLPDPRQSLLELSKGKFTTDPGRHTGEGVFFTSRAFDRFAIRSSELLFVRTARSDDWLVETTDRTFLGTRITLGLITPSTRRIEEVFSRFSSGPEDYRFAKTHVPLRLATYGDDGLISRSSARRVLSRVERFAEVLLDFSGVRSIGQAFADEIFRVFRNAHPNVQLVAINANEQVTLMVRRAESPS